MSNKNYAAVGQPSTEFAPQLDHFDYICGQIQNENRILKFVCIISCLAFFVSIGITLYAISLPDSIPVLVTMDDFGRTNYVGEVSRVNYQNFKVPEAAIDYQIKDFIDLFYGMSSDRTVMKNNINKIHSYLTVNTYQKFSVYVKEKEPYKKFSEEIRTVEFETEPLQLSKDTYQIDFHVISSALTGTLLSNETYRGLITINCMQPNDDDIKTNPLGIYITSFDFKLINTKIYNEGK